MYKTVVAYLDNLIAGGDSLFRQDTEEAIDEALLLYMLAANILGPKSLPVPKEGTMRRQTLRQPTQRPFAIRHRHAGYGTRNAVRPDAVSFGRFGCVVPKLFRTPFGFYAV
jgi:hypothetical protein